MVTTITVEEEVEEVSTTIVTTETTEATEATEVGEAGMVVGATLAAATGTTVEGAILQVVVVAMAEANTAIIPATTIREPWASLRPLGTGAGSIATTDRVAEEEVAVTGEASIVTGEGFSHNSMQKIGGTKL